MKLKQRAKWWIVSTHVLTTGLAMPLLAIIVGGVLCGVLELEGIVADLFISAVQAIGYVGGTYYSLSYLKKKTVTHDWPGCIVPAIVSFAVITVLAIVVSAIRIKESDLVALSLVLLYYGFIIAAFAKITAKGFRALQEEAKLSDAV